METARRPRPRGAVREFGPVRPDRRCFVLRQVCHYAGRGATREARASRRTPPTSTSAGGDSSNRLRSSADFGLVKITRRARTDRALMTGAHTTTGTPRSWRPKSFSRKVDERADVYALRCVAYYLLTRQRVFEADTAMKMFPRARETRPIPRRAHRDADPARARRDRHGLASKRIRAGVPDAEKSCGCCAAAASATRGITRPRAAGGDPSCRAHRPLTTDDANLFVESQAGDFDAHAHARLPPATRPLCREFRQAQAFTASRRHGGRTGGRARVAHLPRGRQRGSAALRWESCRRPLQPDEPVKKSHIS